MKETDDEVWIAAEKALEAACRLPGGRDRIEALKQPADFGFTRTKSAWRKMQSKKS